VVQLGRRLRFAAEALDGAPRETEAGAQDFERDFAVERELKRLIDRTHSTATELAHDLEIAKTSILGLNCERAHPDDS
jgi:hypothetical protein